MADWHGNRHNETYTFKRVAWSNWQEHENYGYITGGTIEFGTDADLKVTGSFDFEGLELPNSTDLLRIYYSFEDDAHEKVNKPIATLFCTYSTQTLVDTLSGIKTSGSLDGLSTLSVLRDRCAGLPYTIRRNSNAIFEAQRLCTECGLNVDYIPANVILGNDHTFESGTSYLEMVNWLCETAGYNDACPDEMGTVLLKPTGARQLTFANDDNSIMYPQVEAENEWQTTANVVRYIYNTDTDCVYAEARNESGSRNSLESRGNREITYYEDIGELGTGNKLVQLMDLAESKVRELSCDTEYVTFSHAYVPILPFDEVTINYADLTWTGITQSVQIELSPSTKTQTQIKRDLTNAITVRKSGTIIRGGDDDS